MMCGSDRKGALERAGWVIGAIALGIAARAVSAQPGTIVVLNKGEASASLIDRHTQQEVALIETGVGPHEVAVSP